MSKLFIAKLALASILSIAAFEATATSVMAQGVSSPAASVRPDVFGTVAIPVAHTPLDGKWRGAWTGEALPASWSRFEASLAGQPARAKLEAVNAFVNRNVLASDDVGGDHWASAAETARRGRGDCEDFAIAKMQLLQAAGVPAGDLFLVIGRDLVARRDHAILIARVGTELLALDSRTERVLRMEEVADFRPSLSYGAGGRWTHGYLAAPPTVLIADADQ